MLKKQMKSHSIRRGGKVYIIKLFKRKRGGKGATLLGVQRRIFPERKKTYDF